MICTLNILDQVNIKFVGLAPEVRRKISAACKYFVPYARHVVSYKLGRWDGYVSFFSIGGSSYINLLDKILPMVIDAGYEIDIVDNRPEYSFSFPEIKEDMFADTCWPVGHVYEGKPIIFRDYQIDVIRRFIDNLQSIQSIATGAGKTIVTAALSKLIEPYGRSIVIVPSKSLVDQTEEDYKNLGLDVGVYFGDRKEFGHTHTIATWQSMGILSKNTKSGVADISIQEFIKDVVCVMIDETHMAKCETIRELMTGSLAHIPIRYGLTGTVPKEPYEFMSLLTSIGPVVGEVKSIDLQNKGVLAKCQVNVLQLQDEGEFVDYHAEHDFLMSDKKRLEWIADYCKMINAEDGSTLILVDRIETGQFLCDTIGDGAVFICGDVKIKDRKAEYKEVQTVDSKIIVATYGVAAVGINVPRLFNLVMVESGKSFVRVIQTVGRILRKAHDKDFAQIHDITSSLKFSKTHLTKRKKFYNDAEFPFNITKVDYK